MIFYIIILPQKKILSKVTRFKGKYGNCAAGTYSLGGQAG